MSNTERSHRFIFFIDPLDKWSTASFSIYTIRNIYVQRHWAEQPKIKRRHRIVHQSCRKCWCPNGYGHRKMNIRKPIWCPQLGCHGPCQRFRWDQKDQSNEKRKNTKSERNLLIQNQIWLLFTASLVRYGVRRQAASNESFSDCDAFRYTVNVKSNLCATTYASARLCLALHHHKPRAENSKSSRAGCILSNCLLARHQQCWSYTRTCGLYYFHFDFICRGRQSFGDLDYHLKRSWCCTQYTWAQSIRNIFKSLVHGIGRKIFFCTGTKLDWNNRLKVWLQRRWCALRHILPKFNPFAKCIRSLQWDWDDFQSCARRFNSNFQLFFCGKYVCVFLATKYCKSIKRSDRY